jgi:hypothetical protein
VGFHPETIVNHRFLSDRGKISIAKDPTLNDNSPQTTNQSSTDYLNHPGSLNSSTIIENMGDGIDQISMAIHPSALFPFSSHMILFKQ